MKKKLKPTFDIFLRTNYGFLKKYYWLEYEDAISGGNVALLKAIKDGKIINDYIPYEVKRYVRREMIRHGSKKLKDANIPDYGYKDGRIAGRIKISKDKQGYKRVRKKLGLCSNCGKKPELDRTLCNRCRKKLNRYRREWLKRKSV